jgi:hypothetical protein
MKTQMYQTIRAILSSPNGATVKQLQKAGIANPSAVVEALRDRGQPILTLRPNGQNAPGRYVMPFGTRDTMMRTPRATLNEIGRDFFEANDLEFRPF